MRALAKSFVFAWHGFVYCLHNERNMRIHMVVTVYMYSFLLFFDFFALTRVEFAIIFIANALVFMGECINTAIESTINLLEKKYNQMAKIAKDTAAAAVLVGSFFAVMIGLVLLWQPEAFKKLYFYYSENTYMLVILAASILISIIYIFAGPDAIRRFFTGKPAKKKYNSNFKGANR